MLETFFIPISVSSQVEERAKEIRKERDKVYKNIFVEEDTDMRWVGEVGEICFNSWLLHEKVPNFMWYLDNPIGNPDFVISGISVGVKTVKRKVPPQLNYTAQVTPKHVYSEPSDYFFFTSYEYLKKRMWLLGGIEKKEFIKLAKYYKIGDAIHKDYIVRHEIYNIEINKLIQPELWLKQVWRT